MSVLTRALDPNNLRPLFDAVSAGSDLVAALREDASFVRATRQALLPLPTDVERLLAPDPFPRPERLDARALKGRRLAVVASGGSGATSAVVGVQRAFEEAGLLPSAIAACSASVLFAGLWACGLDSAAIARFWLTLPRRGYVDPDWSALLRSTGRALGGWAGLLRGEALERSLRDVVGNRCLGETDVPFSLPAWNVDLNRVEFFGTRTTPRIPVALALRVGIAIPIFVEPVRVGKHLYGDGGVVNIFPVRPVIAEAPELILGLNCYLPRGFQGEDVTGWRRRSFAIFRASGQLRWSGMVALAREQALLAGDRLRLLHPVPYAEVRGARFYETFLDRSRWPSFMRAGRLSAREAFLRERAGRPLREAARPDTGQGNRAPPPG